jgi:acyl-CoA reductase-like NAD-dependent aldehyde dehydrogenase
MVATTKPIAYQMYIDGRWVDAESGSTFDIVNPATEEVIATAPEASRGEMRRAIEIARGLRRGALAAHVAARPRPDHPADRRRARRRRPAAELLTAEAGCAQYLMSIQPTTQSACTATPIRAQARNDRDVEPLILEFASAA